ncbi:MAG: ABC transporter ATP-binding protein [Clostridia bacterium]|nr:ABC transporter ATP-binding protein [Clostridia bacterium]
MAGIELKNVKKTYLVDGRELPVLKGIDLDIPEKQITVLLGKSGCGKTTLLRVVGGLEPADSGEILFRVPHKTAFVFQEPRLMPWLSVMRNVSFGLKREEIKPEEIQSIIDVVGLTGFEKALPAQLSGGMQHRTAIARALAYHPSFIMMDEPFAALDYFTREQMQRELLRIQQEQKTSILFVTHSLDEALILADQIAIIRDGKIGQLFSIDVPQMERDVMSPSMITTKREILSHLDLTTGA